MITGYFGLPGCGKSTFLAMLARRELNKIKRGKSSYVRVYTNFPVSGCYPIRYEDLGSLAYSDCLILLDEITMFADSRDFKRFSQKTRDFFIYHRHYKVDIVYFTQFYDAVDKKIRDLTSSLWYVTKSGVFSRARRIFRTIDIDDHTHDIVCGYRFPLLSERLFRLVPLVRHLFPKVSQWCYRRRWYRFFDSFDAPVLPAPDETGTWDDLANSPSVSSSPVETSSTH